MADLDGEGEGGRGYLRQVEETARYLRQSKGGASDIGKQGECTERIVMMTLIVCQNVYVL